MARPLLIPLEKMIDLLGLSSKRKDDVMNQSQISGKWKEIRGQVRQQWGKLTNDDLDRIDGKREELVGRIQQAYGKSRDEADREVDAFFSKLN
jgi:uncharacterized protein YjbJ (UPF0337 family)